MLQNQQNLQMSCNKKDHQNQIISAICTRKECEQQSTICQRCLVTFHKLCVDQIIFVDDLNLEISKMENETDLINQIFESLKQKLVKLQKQHQLLLNSIREYIEIPNITNLNNVGSMLRTTHVDLEKILQGNELISQLIENYLNPVKLKKLSQKQIKEIEKIHDEGDVHYNKGEYEGAIEYYDRALGINPFSDIYWSSKGLALQNLSKYQEAIQCYDQALKINSNDDNTWNNKGVALYNLDQYIQAIHSYDQALKINPNNDNAWNNKGLALKKVNKYQEAIQCHDQALKINQNHDKAWNNKGFALYNLNKYQEAIQCYDKSISIKPTALRYYNKSLALESASSKPQSWIQIKKMLRASQKQFRRNRRNDQQIINKMINFQQIYFIQKQRQIIEKFARSDLTKMISFFIYEYQCLQSIGQSISIIK